MFAARPELLNLLKSGGHHFRGLDEVTFKNIDACKKLSELTKSSLGPLGKKENYYIYAAGSNKLIVNHLEKLYITSDTATQLQQLEIQHPAAKIIAAAAKMQKQEFGDCVNFVVLIAGALLNHAGLLLNSGIHLADIISGYEKALKKALEVMKDSVCLTVKNIKDESELLPVITSAIASKALGYEDTIAPLVIKAVLHILPSNPANLDLDNLRIAKVIGGAVESSMFVTGMVIPRNVTGRITEKKNCNVMVLGCGLELATTETKGTVLIRNADELMNFSNSEEDELEKIIKAVADSGVGAIIVGGSISDIGQHFCDKYEILTLKIQSKFDLRRVCRTLRASAMVKLQKPNVEELGFAESISVTEIASTTTTIIQGRDSNVATIVVRGATQNILDEIERAIDDGARRIQNIAKDNRFVPGAGCTEVQLSVKLEEVGKKIFELEQAAFLQFGEALEEVPRTLASTAGLHYINVISELFAQHQAGEKYTGVDIGLYGDYKYTSELSTMNVVDRTDKIVDHYKAKESALKLATDAVLNILRVDQIIMARPAGGPNPRN